MGGYGEKRHDAGQVSAALHRVQSSHVSGDYATDYDIANFHNVFPAYLKSIKIILQNEKTVTAMETIHLLVLQVNIKTRHEFSNPIFIMSMFYLVLLMVHPLLSNMILTLKVL